DPALRQRLLYRIQELAGGIASTFQLDAEVNMTDACPATINDTEMAELVRSVGARVVGQQNVLGDTRTTGSEDMSVFLNEVGGCFFFVGSANAERGLAGPHHSPTFDFDERALELGVRMLTGVAIECLER